MHAALGFRLEHAVVGPQPLAHTIHVQRAAAVGHINAVRAVAFHQQGLLGQRLGVDHVAHHQKARYIHTEIAGDTDMLLGNVRSEEHTSELQSLMRISYAVFCLKKKKKKRKYIKIPYHINNVITTKKTHKYISQ